MREPNHRETTSAQTWARKIGYASFWVLPGASLIALAIFLPDVQSQVYYIVAGVLLITVGIATIASPKLRVILMRQYYGSRNQPPETTVPLEDLLEAQIARVRNECETMVRVGATGPIDVKCVDARPDVLVVNSKNLALIPARMSTDSLTWVEGRCIAVYESPLWRATGIFFLGNKDEVITQLRAFNLK